VPLGGTGIARRGNVVGRGMPGAEATGAVTHLDGSRSISPVHDTLDIPARVGHQHLVDPRCISFQGKELISDDS